ncbi:four helix bundle protein [Candidatus Microgenomates bacterium]|nr:four helix bundle protein [Candidatus Microgenomates bacterium]
MSDLTQAEVIKEQIAKTLKELSTPKKPLQRSRIWQDPQGFQYLAVWQNAALLRVLVRKFTATLPFSERRLKAQLDDAARSQKRNIEEGWKRSTTSEYLNFLGYAQGSLEEVKGDLRDAKTDGFLKSIAGSSLLSLGINLRELKGPNQIKGEPTDPSHPYHQPLSTLNGHTLTYEIFMELINKTDYLLRLLVQSLEKKLRKDQKGYRIEQERIKEKFRP